MPSKKSLPATDRTYVLKPHRREKFKIVLNVAGTQVLDSSESLFLSGGHVFSCFDVFASFNVFTVGFAPFVQFREELSGTRRH